MMVSALTELICSNCGQSYAANQVQTYCLDCQAPLLASYALEGVYERLDRDEVRHRPPGMWRWQELLPVSDPAAITTLGEGDTPLLSLPRLGAELSPHATGLHPLGRGFHLPNLLVKDESGNPTGTFKARGLAAAVSKARELGITRVIIPTAGNAGGAMAAYAARAGMQACVVMPRTAPSANYEECRISGAEVILVEGSIREAGRLAAEKARSEGWLDLSTFKEPYRLEGKKVMGYELAESFGWELPEVILYPTGGGTGLVGMWKAFAELETLGWLEKADRPRMVVVQAAGCAPVVKAFEAGLDTCQPWENPETIATGLRVPKSFADHLILRCLYESDGTALAVSDEEILAAQRRLASTEGIFAAPEGAATLAGLLKLLERGWIDPAERIVLFNTGTGLKYLP